MTKSSTSLLLIVACAVSVYGQNLAEDCSDSPGVGSLTLPITTTALDPVSADFDLSAAGCSGEPAAWDDAVVCFQPEFDCNVDLFCNDANVSLVAGGSNWISVFTGGCTAAPASCVATAIGSSSSSILNQPVVAGTNYCVVCQDDVGIRNMSITISTASGSCGVVPVTLYEFSIE